MLSRASSSPSNSSTTVVSGEVLSDCNRLFSRSIKADFDPRDDSCRVYSRLRNSFADNVLGSRNASLSITAAIGKQLAANETTSAKCRPPMIQQKFAAGITTFVAARSKA